MPFTHITLKAKKPSHLVYPKTLKTLGDHIRKRRLDLGLFQEQIARRIGVDAVTVYNWERNRNSPHLRVIPKIIAFLGYAPCQPAKSLPEKLLSCRRLLGLSQKQMAKMIGIDPYTLGKFERGKGQAMERTLERIEGFIFG
ncbi:MAG: helix-turn-helix domain-containing protein [bacterium]